MTKVFQSPAKYIQGPGEMNKLGDYASALGKKAFCLISGGGMKRQGAQIEKSFEGKAASVRFEKFNGECSWNEIGRLLEMVKDTGSDLMIGVGGGKIFDTAKAVAHKAGIPVIICPTIASTDAPCSALSVIYSDTGVFQEYYFFPNNPNLVLMDTQIIAASPVRLTVSGMGDALATYYEARACEQANASTYAGGTSTMTGLELARLCYRTVLEEGYTAKLAADTDIPSKSLEKIVEANVLLSGLAFESAGIAAAHAISNGFTQLADCRGTYHGELVAFGTLVQLVLENAPREEIDEVRKFCYQVGLPMTLEGLGIKEVTDSKIWIVCKAATDPEESIHNMPFPVTDSDVYSAIMVADALGRDYPEK